MRRRPPPADVPEPGVTLDALTGDWRIYQLRRGHRWSTDDLLLAYFAWDVVQRAGHPVAHLCDLGSGIGSVGFSLAWLFPDARLTSVEAQPESLALARRTAAYNGITARCDLRPGDLRDPGALPERAFAELVTGSPPYFDRLDGTVSEAPQRGPCRFELRGTIADYAQAAARALRPGGFFACVMPAVDDPRVAAGALAAGLQVVERLPVVFKAGREPYLTLTACRAAGLAGPCVDHPPLVIRERDDRRSEAFRAIRRALGFPEAVA